ncbi:hypothetical protein BJ166DRAFT_519283 [Pestalotiopsis sp. NC0098]|nr:hypothetical protein BJ166DRAFT_519283 [Pestalotiopsis sp. NC0098]
MYIITKSAESRIFFSAAILISFWQIVRVLFAPRKTPGLTYLSADGFLQLAALSYAQSILLILTWV